MLKKFSFIVILMSAVTLTDCTETESDSQILSRLATLVTILEDQDGSVLDLSQQRVYIDPGKIAINNQGLIVYSTDKEMIILPELFSGCNGCYVSCSDRDLEMLYQSDGLRAWWCSGCKRMRKMNDYGCCTSCCRKL